MCGIHSFPWERCISLGQIISKGFRQQGKTGLMGETKRQAKFPSMGPLLREVIDIGAPGFFSIVAFLSGAVLIGAAAAPDVFQNRALMRIIAPLPVVELSHFLASIIGTMLLFVAAGLRQRLDSAWMIAVILLGAGAVFSLLSGGHAWRAISLAVVMALLAVSRHAFYRQSALTELRVRPWWLAAMLVVIAGIAWLGFNTFNNIQYRDDLWWTFASDADASRFLRSLVTVGTVFLLLCAWLILRLRWAAPSVAREPGVDLQLARIITEGDFVSPDANLAFLPDKRFLFSESGDSFIMYGVQGRSWIAMGPPVGKKFEARELAWKYKSEADAFGAHTVFYSFDEAFLPIALDLGLGVQKVGESAVINLVDYSLEGSANAKLRQAQRGLEKHGCEFAVIGPEEVAQRLSEMRAASDAWLNIHHGAEKRFTLGCFDEAYVARFPAAVALKDGRICAFANLWTSKSAKALSIDLMRYGEDAPPGVMDGLFINLALWGKEQGYESLDLGMAPLAGLEARRIAPAMTRLGALIYEHAEDLYGFSGLRRYKEKFHPGWKPLYIAAPSKLGAAFALGGVALLTSGGLKGVFKKG